MAAPREARETAGEPPRARDPTVRRRPRAARPASNEWTPAGSEATRPDPTRRDLTRRDPTRGPEARRAVAGARAEAGRAEAGRHGVRERPPGAPRPTRAPPDRPPAAAARAEARRGAGEPSRNKPVTTVPFSVPGLVGEER